MVLFGDYFDNVLVIEFGSLDFVKIVKVDLVILEWEDFESVALSIGFGSGLIDGVFGFGNER